MRSFQDLPLEPFHDIVDLLIDVDVEGACNLLQVSLLTCEKIKVHSTLNFHLDRHVRHSAKIRSTSMSDTDIWRRDQATQDV